MSVIYSLSLPLSSAFRRIVRGFSRERRSSRGLAANPVPVRYGVNQAPFRFATGQAGFSALGFIVTVFIICSVLFSGFLLFNRSSTTSKLHSLQTQVDSLEQTAKSGNFSPEAQNTLDNIQAKIKDLQSKPANLPDDTKAQLSDMVARLDKLEANTVITGPKGATGTQGPNGNTGTIGATGLTGPAGPSGIASCPNGNCLSLQATSPGVQETGNINVSGTVKAGSFSGSGAGLTGVDASYLSGFNAGYFVNATNISSGTLADARLNTTVSLLGQTISNAELENSSLTITTSTGLSGGGAVSLGGTLTLANAGVLSVIGTTNQITVSASTGNVIFSLPQDIAVTSSPTFANLTITTSLTTATLTYGTSISSNCAGLTGYVWIPGNPKFGTMPGFCVMKYEAKDDGSGNAVSTATGTPYVSISQRTAQDKANAACTGCHLISEAEWMTIATNALWQNANWCNTDGSACGFAPGTASKYLASGHNDNAPAQALTASATDSEACYGTITAGTNTACGSAGTQKRTLTLSNGTIIWDIPGNVWEWTDAWIIGNEQPNDAVDGFAYHEFTAITKWKDLNYANPTNRGWNSTQRLGQIYTDGTSTNNTLYGFVRGGGWSGGSAAGAFALHLGSAPAAASAGIGFRVAR